MQLMFNPPQINAAPSGLIAEKYLVEKQTATKSLATKRRRSDRIRDHLANERTYLAWMRSAIALMGFGIVIVRIRMFQPPMLPSTGMSWKLGLAFAIVGLLTVWLSTQHYFGVRRDIDEDMYEPPDRWVMLFSLAVLLLGAGIIYYVFAVPPQVMIGATFE